MNIPMVDLMFWDLLKVRIRIPWDENHHFNHLIWGNNMFFSNQLKQQIWVFQLANLRIDVKGALFKKKPLEQKALRSKPKLTWHQNPRYDSWLHVGNTLFVTRIFFVCIFVCISVCIFVCMYFLVYHYIIYIYHNYVYLSQKKIGKPWSIICFCGLFVSANG